MSASCKWPDCRCVMPDSCPEYRAGMASVFGRNRPRDRVPLPSSPPLQQERWCPECNSEEWDRVTDKSAPGASFNRCHRCENEWTDECTVCGKAEADHGSFPTCASHAYTPDGLCRVVQQWDRTIVPWLPCPGSVCNTKGCVRTAPAIAKATGSPA